MVPSPARDHGDRLGKMGKGSPRRMSAQSPGNLSPGNLSLGNATGLSCRECGRSYPLGASYACEACFGPLEVSYDFPRLTRADIENGPLNMWRYAPLLPVPFDIASRPTLDPGWTRLIRADNLAREL